MAINGAQAFTNALSVTIPQTTHGITHNAIRMQLWDQGTPRQRVVAPLSLDPTTLALGATFPMPQSGLLVWNAFAPEPGPLVTMSVPFSLPAGGSFTLPGTQHGYGTDHLLVDVYDNATPRHLLPLTPVSVHPTTFDIVVSSTVPLSGHLVVCAAAADSGLANLSQPFSLAGAGSVTWPGVTHLRDTAALGLAVYDTLGLAVIPADVTVDPTTFDVVVSFGGAQEGRLVLAGGVAEPSGPTLPADTSCWMVLTDLPGAKTIVHLPVATRAVRFWTPDAQIWYALDTAPGPIPAPVTDNQVQATAFRLGDVIMPNATQQVVLPGDQLPHTLQLVSQAIAPLLLLTALVETPV